MPERILHLHNGAFNCCVLFRTARITLLYWWTFHRSVTTEDATVTLLRLQYSFAAGAFIEEHAGIGGHRFTFLEVADRACNC